jgi:hypothetical protein
MYDSTNVTLLTLTEDNRFRKVRIYGFTGEVKGAHVVLVTMSGLFNPMNKFSILILVCAVSMALCNGGLHPVHRHGQACVGSIIGSSGRHLSVFVGISS